MKKNVMMRVASLLMVCVLATTCGISGTFAKYVTKADAQDDARVAKWGVTIGVVSETAFGEKYNNTVVADGVKVVSTGGDVVAPGTEGTLGTVAIAGQPEVMVDVAVDVNFEIAGWVVPDAINYFPIAIVVAGEVVDIDVDATVEDIEEAVEAAVLEAVFGNADAITIDGGVSSKVVRYDANHNFGVAGDTDVTVGWYWPFYVSEQFDKYDTALGDQAAAGDAATIEFSISISVTQVD